MHLRTWSAIQSEQMITFAWHDIIRIKNGRLISIKRRCFDTEALQTEVIRISNEAFPFWPSLSLSKQKHVHNQTMQANEHHWCKWKTLYVPKCCNTGWKKYLR